MAKFVQKEPNLGFDSNAGHPWQMVPVGGARGVLLKDGAHLQVSISAYGGGPTNSATFNEVPLPTKNVREFWISGHSHGAAVLEARNPKTSRVEATLQIAVLDKQEVKVAFYMVSDSAGHKTEQINCSSAVEILSTANSILSLQSNVHLRPLHCSDVTSKYNLGDVINVIGSDPSVTWFKFAEMVKEWQADFHVFFVWELREESDAADEDATAVTRSQVCIFEQNHKGRDRGVSLAHEVGHFLSLEHMKAPADVVNLMYPYNNRTGFLLTKGQSLAINNRVRQGLTPPSP